jgi:transposase-like protein
MLKKIKRIILAGISNIAAYNTELSRLKERCTCSCGIANSLRSHGHYFRKLNRHIKGEQSLILVKILRFLCNTCHKTCSVLPECIPPRRWYVWEVQQNVIQKYLDGDGWNEISAEMGISISTCKRWCKWFLDKYNIYAAVLKNVAGNLGEILRDSADDFKIFWQKCFTNISLDRAMLLCHQSGVGTP